MTEEKDASPQMRRGVEDEHTKTRLINEICALHDSRAALDLAIDERREALRRLMEKSGDKNREAPAGKAFFRGTTKFRVTNAQKLARLCKPDVLAQIASPTKAWFEAAKRVNPEIAECVTPFVSTSFQVERSKTAQAIANQQSAINEARQKLEKEIDGFVSLLQGGEMP